MTYLADGYAYTDQSGHLCERSYQDDDDDLIRMRISDRAWKRLFDERQREDADAEGEKLETQGYSGTGEFSALMASAIDRAEWRERQRDAEIWRERGEK